MVRVRSEYGVLKGIIFWYSSDSYAETASSFDGNSIITVRCPRVLSFSIVAKSLTKNSPLTEGNQSFNAFK